MTNVQIIEARKQELAAEGILDYTGRTFTCDDGNGGEIVIREVEDIHTFATWKSMGFKVKKGEHAVCRFAIWKPAITKVETEDGEDEKVGRMFLKDSCWFTSKQVEPA